MRDNVHSHPKFKPTLESICLKDVEPRAIDWLWPGRIARGKLTLIAGEVDLGKSQLSLWIASTITRGGNWPAKEGKACVGTVLIFASEDGVADTIVPRMLAADADLSRVHVVSSETGFNLARDLDLLELKIREFEDVSLIIMDSLSSYVGGIDSHSNTAVRNVLEPVNRLAERTNVAILGITHPPKMPSGKAKNMFMGSLAFIANARSGFLVFPDDEDPDRRLFLQAKNNLARKAKGLAFKLVEHKLADGITTTRVEWEGDYVNVSADEAMRAGEKPNKLDEAKKFLRNILSKGPMFSKKLEQRARSLGIKARTLMRAREDLGVIATKQPDGSWLCSLPGAGE